MQRLFGNHIQPACRYCEQALRCGRDGTVLCELKGVVAADYHCRRYVYDPLKREPKSKVRLPQYASDDFDL